MAQTAGIRIATLNGCSGDPDNNKPTHAKFVCSVDGFGKPIELRVKADLSPGSELHRLVTAATRGQFDQSGPDFDLDTLKGKRITVLVLRRKGPNGGFVIAYVFSLKELQDAAAELAA
jgi:hypothetical protein